MHFTNLPGEHTIDLSCFLIGKINYHLNWTSKKYNNSAIHSGDSWSRSGDCAEYIDLNVKELVEAGMKYAVFYLHNYKQSIGLVKGNRFGFCGIDNPQHNKLWLPSTIEVEYMINDLNNKIITCVLDLTTKEYIQIDIEESNSGIQINEAAISGFCKVPDVSVYSLLRMHAETRGIIVENKEDADVKFEFDYFSKSYQNIIDYMI